MNILFISHSSLATGSERVFAEIINNRIKIDNCYVVIPNEKLDKFSSIISRKVKKHKLFYKNVSDSNFKSLICCLYNMPSVIYLYILCYVKNIDLLYINTSANLLGALLCIVLKKSIIFHVHEQPNSNTKVISKLLLPLYRHLFAKKNITLIFTSIKCKRNWEKELGININSYKIVNPPIRKVKLHEKSVCSDTVTYGYLGTLHSSKNIIALLEAFAILVRHTDYKCSLMICGSGPLLNDIYMYINKLELNGKVNILNYTENVDSFYSKIDVLVQPSLNESWSMVVVESISLKIPTIVTQESGIAELLVHDQESLIINPLDITDIYTSMKKMICSKYRKRIAENAYNKYCLIDFNKTFYYKINDIISTCK